jgi:hypothetical protein
MELFRCGIAGNAIERIPIRAQLLAINSKL